MTESQLFACAWQIVSVMLTDGEWFLSNDTTERFGTPTGVQSTHCGLRILLKGESPVFWRMKGSEAQAVERIVNILLHDCFLSTSPNPWKPERCFIPVHSPGISGYPFCPVYWEPAFQCGDGMTPGFTTGNTSEFGDLLIMHYTGRDDWQFIDKEIVDDSGLIWLTRI